VKPLPIFVAVGVVTAVFAALLQKRLESAQPVDNWEPVTLD